MSDEPIPTSPNPASEHQLPSFAEMLDVSQKNIIKGLWNVDDLSIPDKIDSIDVFSDKLSLEARKEYRKWRFLMDRSRMPNFYHLQNDYIKKIITAMLKESTDLEEFARTIMSIKSSLNSPDSFDKWMKNEEIEFEEPPIPEDTKNASTSRSSRRPYKRNAMPLVTNTMTKLPRNINNSQIDGDNSFDNSHKILFYLCYQNNDNSEGRICLFNSSTCSVEEITKFNYYYESYEVATTQNKIFAIGSRYSFEIYDLNTRQVSRGPDPPEWREYASVIYFKDKLYYLGGKDPKTEEKTNRVDVLIDGIWQIGAAFPLSVIFPKTITCDEILYVIDGHDNGKIYRLSDDEREWIEIGEVPEKRRSFGVASLNGRIYITGGKNGDDVFKSCLCFDPSAPVDSRISRIAYMNHVRYHHSLIVANGKLYAIGGFFNGNVCNSIEEYDPQTNEWREVGEINIE